MASPTAARPHHGHAPLDNEDAVMARALEFSDWARKNARVLGTVLTVALVLVLGTVYYQWQQGQAAGRAATEYMRVLPALPVDNPTAAATQLQQFIATYDGTAEADEARMMLAQTYLKEGNAAKAVEAAQQVAEGDHMRWQGAMLLAAAQVAAKQPQQAIATYLAAADEAELNMQKEEAIGQAGLLREQAGDFKGAAELFQRLVDMTEEGSAERGVYEMRLGEVKAAAGAAAK